jgi:hypothetical protein
LVDFCCRLSGVIDDFVVIKSMPFLSSQSHALLSRLVIK